MTRLLGENQKLIGKPPSKAKIERDEAVAALHAVQSARPKKPPPYRFEGSCVSAGARALAADKRAGLV